MSAATIVFLDIVGFSRNPNSRQRELVDSLTSEVTSSLSALMSPPLETHVVAMPTGDGMALAFLHKPGQPWDISTVMGLIYRVEGWAKDGAVSLRIGVHQGEVEFITDINNKTNIVGDTINYTQRVMDAANPKQVLFSDTAFRQYIGSNNPSYSAPPYGPGCKAVFEGPFEVQAKHGMRMLVYKMTLEPAQDWLSNDDPASKMAPGESKESTKPITTSTPLLTTKLFIPPARPGLVSRPRLMECLESALNCNFVLVSAPAGFGKTTLVSDWVRQNQSQVPTGWVSLDEGDNDPVRFWDYFIAAVKTIQPAAGETSLSLLHSPQPYPTESVLTALINDLSTIQDDFSVVLDDYHLIKAEAIQQGLAFLLDHLPPKMHLIIASRTNPTLALSHFRGRGTMLEISAEDLRFTKQEAAGLFKGLAAEDIEAMNNRTEGWVTGLRMAALSLGQRKDVKSFIDRFTGSQRYVTDYLVEEVLGQQSDEVQNFLIRTSVLERLTAPLCDFLTGHTGSQKMLVKLESSFGGFLVPLDESRQWYRYHHLFAELLRHQLEAKSGAKEVDALHQRASQWYEDNGFSDDAVHHALVTRDWERAMRLISYVADDLIKRAEMRTLINRLEVIPDEVLRTDFHLYLQYARALVQTGQLDTAETALSYLKDADQTDVVQGVVAALQADLAMRKGDIPRAIELAEKALSLLPADNFLYRCRASHTLGLVRFDQGLYNECLLRMTDASTLGGKAGDYLVATAALVYLSWLLWWRGSLPDALEMHRQALELAGQSPAAGPAYYFRGWVHYEHNELEQAVSSFLKAIELFTIRGTPDNLANTYSLLAQTRQALGDSAAANEAMEKADQEPRHGTIRPATRGCLAAIHVLLAIRQNNPTAASGWGQRLSQYRDALPFYAHDISARLLIAQGERAAAIEQLQAYYESASEAGAQVFLIRIRIYQALAAASPSEALDYLAEALTLAQPEGIIRFFVDERQLLAPLLRQALAQGITPEYTGKLLGIIEEEERQRKT